MDTTKGQEAPEAESAVEHKASQDFDDKTEVPLESLSELTGFPIEFIKKELLLDEQNISMGELRQSIIRYLETNAGEFQI